MGSLLENKVALVTGGGSGIGKAVARRFAEEGALVTLSDVSQRSGEKTVEELRRDGLHVSFSLTDARDEAGVKSLIASIVADKGRLDIAVNNVGGLDANDTPGISIVDTSYQAWKATIDFSLNSTFLAMKYELEQMAMQGGGVIANTSSTSALLISNKSTPAYSVAKLGVLHLTRTAALQYASRNIRINAVAPGLTKTEAVISAFTPDELTAFGKQAVPLGGILAPRQLADAFLFLCSDASSGITGVVLPVDGGQSAA
jgi:NAD(P)-dependent dehydrogenase (short-subunit alcohol dehydrogenase family)